MCNILSIAPYAIAMSGWDLNLTYWIKKKKSKKLRLINNCCEMEGVNCIKSQFLNICTRRIDMKNSSTFGY